MTKAKQVSEKDGKQYLRDAFHLEQKLLKVQLDLSIQTITHPGTQGTVNEYYFINVLKKYLPRRYAVDTGIVIDSNGKCSNQIDVVIFDHQYTPTLLDQNNHRFIPIEAVYAIFESKPSIGKETLKYAGEKAASVRSLHKTSIPIPHAGGEYPAKELFDIIAGIVAVNVSWADGFKSEAFAENLNSLSGNDIINCGLAALGGCFDLYQGSLKIGPTDEGLGYFIFRLLQKLQSLGTVPAVDWNEYASVMMKADTHIA